MEPTCRNRLLQLLGRRRGSPCEHLRLANAFTRAHPQADKVTRTHEGACGPRVRTGSGADVGGPHVHVREKQSNAGGPVRSGTPAYTQVWASGR
jgi:hypothetical protein